MFTGNVYYVYYCSVELGKLNNHNNNNNNHNNNNSEFISEYPFYTKFVLRLKIIYKKEIVYYIKNYKIIS